MQEQRIRVDYDPTARIPRSQVMAFKDRVEDATRVIRDNDFCRRVASIKLMLLYMSSGVFKYLGGFAEDRVDFASRIAFEATNDFDLAHSFRCSSTQVGLRPQVVAQSDDDYTIQRRIGLAITTAVEPMPVGLAG